MDYIGLEIITDSTNEELITDLLYGFDISGVEIEDEKLLYDLKKSLKDMSELVDFEGDYDRNIKITTHFEEDYFEENEERIKKSLEDFPGIDYKFFKVLNKNWNEEWMKHYDIKKIEEKVVIKPSWIDYEKEDGDIVLELDPGMSFGTGYHATTELMVKYIYHNFKGGVAYDIGTGSGILAILLEKMGAEKVYAADISEDSKEAVEVNSKLNKCEKIEFHLGNLQEGIEEKCDFYVSNILASLIIPQIRSLRNHLNPGGEFLFTGIIDSKEEEVMEVLREENLSLISREELDNWVILHGRLDA